MEILGLSQLVVESVWVEKVWKSRLSRPYFPNENISLIIFDKYVHFDAVVKRFVFTLWLGTGNSRICHDNVPLFVLVQVFHNVRQAAEVFWVDRPIFVFVHVVYVPPLDVVWNPRVAVPLDDSLKVGGVVVPPPTQVEPQRPEGRQVGSPDHLCVLSGHIQGGRPEHNKQIENTPDGPEGKSPSLVLPVRLESGLGCVAAQ